jgi:GNAT superfamily N-acetyltransferase
VTDPFELRPVRVDDAEEMAENVRLGFESYRPWTRRGWDPPPSDMEAPHIAEKLREPGVWATVALVDGAHVGHVAVAPGRTRDETRTPIPGLAHLWQLFVRPPWWGSGLATRLLALAVDAAADRGYPRMRLFTPAGNARGRAFYEREGWRLHGDAAYEPMLGLDLVEYRRDLPTAPR